VSPSKARVTRSQVYRTIRQQILTLKLAPGAIMSENDLASTLGVSRTPIREALLLLADEGLVEVFPRVGSFVARMHLERIAEAQFLREAVEMASLRSLRLPLADEAVSTLTENLNAQAKEGIGLDAFFALDEQFHQGLMAAAGHSRSWATVAAAKGHLDRARMLTLITQADLDRLAAEHAAVFDAAMAGDIDAAAAALHDHLYRVFADIEAIEKISPDLFRTEPAAVPVRKSVIVWQ
jgi:DNA-binding GntR family transcriptional regulator